MFSQFTSIPYSDYINSSHWANFRDTYHTEHPNAKCAECPAPATDLHHKSYENVGHETAADVDPLCKRCHGKKHPKRQIDRFIFRLARRMRADGVDASVDEMSKVYAANKVFLHGMEKYDFMTVLEHGFRKANMDYGDGKLHAAMVEADKHPVTGLPDDLPHPLRRLAGLCAYLQAQAGDEPFFLAQVGIQEIFGIERHAASRWLKILKIIGVLEIVKKGHTGRATEYRYVGPMA